MSGRSVTRPISRWWMVERAYRGYVLRSLSSVVLLVWLLNVLVGLRRLGQGPYAWARWVEAQQQPVALALQVCVLVLALHHSATWLSLGPKLLPPVIAGHRVRPRLVQALGWVTVFASLAFGLSRLGAR